MANAHGKHKYPNSRHMPILPIYWSSPPSPLPRAGAYAYCAWLLISRLRAVGLCSWTLMRNGKSLKLCKPGDKRWRNWDFSEYNSSLQFFTDRCLIPYSHSSFRVARKKKRLLLVCLAIFLRKNKFLKPSKVNFPSHSIILALSFGELFRSR